MKVYRQGDCLFVPVDRIPLPHYYSQQKSRLIRQGEHGGRHQVAAATTGRPVAPVLVNKDGDRYVDAQLFGTIIEHRGHEPVRLPRGLYHVVIQREWLTGQVVD